MSTNKRLVSRRNFMRVAIVGTGAAALAACAAPPAAPAPAAPAAPAANEAKPTEAPAAVSTGPVEIIFWGHADHPIYDAGQAFMKKNPDVKFTQVELGDDRVQKVDATLAAGSGAPDLFWYEATDVQRLGRTGALLDVDEVVRKHEKDLVAAKLSEARVKGKYYGMPGDITPNTLWVRPDILEKAGVAMFDKNLKYEDFITAAKTVKEKADSSLFVFGADAGGQSTLLFQCPFYALGGNVSDESGEEILFDTGDAAVKSVEYAKMAWDSKAGLDAGWFSPPYWAAIKEGKLGGTYSPPWMRGFFQTEVKTPEEGQGKWKNMILPAYAGGEKARTNVWGGATLCSFTQTKHPDTVKNFMEYTFATDEGATVTGDWGIVPPYLPWLTTKLKNAKQTLFSDATWADTVNEALSMMRADFYRAPAYGLSGIAGGPLFEKYFVPMMKGELDIKTGIKQWADDLRSENKKLLDSLK
jgi:ABC-type glycerol-3-phosphate transport system substrate-binding protein